MTECILCHKETEIISKTLGVCPGCIRAKPAETLGITNQVHRNCRLQFGFPEYAHRSGPETGYTNLAVFFQACSFNCLCCQNWHFRNDTLKPRTSSINDLVADIDERTACICFFGGDPTPQLPFTSRETAESCRAIAKAAGLKNVRIGNTHLLV